MNSPAQELLAEARVDEYNREAVRLQRELAAERLHRQTTATRTRFSPRRWAAGCLIRAGALLSAAGSLLCGAPRTDEEGQPLAKPALPPRGG